MNLRTDFSIAIEAIETYADQANAKRRPVVNQVPMRTLADRLGLERRIANGGLSGRHLRTFLQDYLDASTCLQHPGYMAHQVAVPHPHTSIASFIDGFTNNAMAIYEMGPAAATVEHAVLNWMLEKAGWRRMPYPGDLTPDAHGGGVLTHGGSLANLTALLAARSRIAPHAWDDGTPSNLVIIASDSCHYSIARAAGILGIGQKALRYAPADSDGRLDPAALRTVIKSLREQGLDPLAVVANACGTAAGLYDPLREIGGVCRELDVWLHVDGAHGASALVSKRFRSLLDGVELADSLVWDAHKMLRTPTLCAAVLVRDHTHLDTALREEASYLFHDKDQLGVDFIHRTVECTKAAIGLKLFFSLAADGEKAIENFIDRQFDLAKDAAKYLRAQPGVVVAAEPQSNIVCFRLNGSDELQLDLRRRLTESGNHYVSTTTFRGQRWLRLALMNPATDINDIRALIGEIRQILDAGVL